MAKTGQNINQAMISPCLKNMQVVPPVDLAGRSQLLTLQVDHSGK